MPVHERVENPASKVAVRRKASDSTSDSQSGVRHPLMTMQRSYGNAYVARLLAQRAEAEEELQMKRDPDSSNSKPEVGLEGGQISEGLTNKINSARGGGAALDDSTRATMEHSFGDSFEDVRIHTDGEADSLNRSVSAKAFTTGSDIFFSQNASPSDSSLLAHELTHVVQQRGAGNPSGPLTVGPAGDAHEMAANSAAGSVASGTAVASAQRAAEEEEDVAAPISRAEVPAPEEELPM
jgi:hypothetical protein